MSWDVLVPVTITFVIANLILLLRGGASSQFARLGAGRADRPSMAAAVDGPAARGPGRPLGPTTPVDTERGGTAARQGARQPGELDVLIAASPALPWDRCRIPGCDHKRDHRRDRRP